MRKYLLALVAGAAVVRLLRTNKRASRTGDGGFLAAIGDDHYWRPSGSAPRRHLASVLAAYQENERG